MLFNLDLYNFTDFDQLNKYLIKKFNIPAFQHRIILRLSIFSFKMLNFVSAPKILKEVIVKNFQEKSLIEKPDLVDDNKESVFIPENTRTFRNGETFSTKHDVVSKFCLKHLTTSQTLFKNFLNQIFLKKNSAHLTHG